MIVSLYSWQSILSLSVLGNKYWLLHIYYDVPLLLPRLICICSLLLISPSVPSFCTRLLLWYQLVIMRMNNLSSSHRWRSVQPLWLAHTNVFEWPIQMWLTDPYKCVWLDHTDGSRLLPPHRITFLSPTPWYSWKSINRHSHCYCHWQSRGGLGGVINGYNQRV